MGGGGKCWVMTGKIFLECFEESENALEGNHMSRLTLGGFGLSFSKENIVSIN